MNCVVDQECCSLINLYGTFKIFLLLALSGIGYGSGSGMTWKVRSGLGTNHFGSTTLLNKKLKKQLDNIKNLTLKI
jgi:hypothetical protein